ncbi:hypothetical protein Q9R32_00645 [Actinotalea sp. AC32]|nr:hypothetical protein [Actinotalea sp. AC32]
MTTEILGPAVLVAVGVAAASGAQVLSGMGFAMLAGPFLVLVLGPTEGVRLTIALGLLLNAVLLAATWSSVRWGDTLRLLVPAALLVAPAAFVTGRMGTAWVTGAAGVAVLAGVALLASGLRAAWVEGPAGPVAAGAASGVLNVLAGTSGPPIALFVAHRSWPPRVSTATMQAYSLPLNVVTLAVIGLPSAGGAPLAGAGVGLVVGGGLAWPFVRRIGPAVVRAMVLALAGMGGLSLLGAAVTG